MKTNFISLIKREVNLRGDFRAGEGNQILVFQKILCLALSIGANVVTPKLFHCDRTVVPDDCNTTQTIPLQDLLTVSPRARQTFTIRPPTRIIKQAYYIRDNCGPGSAFGFPDVIGLNSRVTVYGETLRTQCPNPCVVIQIRVGKDWGPHSLAFPKANVSITTLQTVLRAYHNYNFLTLAPERVMINIPVPRIRHNAAIHPTVRFLGEIYVASRANVFFYNDFSTTHHLVRRLASHSLQMLKLR